MRNHPLLATFHVARKWPQLRLTSTTRSVGILCAQHEAASCRFVFNLKLDDGEPFSISTAISFQSNVRLPIYTLGSSENISLPKSCAKVTLEQMALCKFFSAETSAAAKLKLGGARSCNRG